MFCLTAKYCTYMSASVNDNYFNFHSFTFDLPSEPV